MKPVTGLQGARRRIAYVLLYELIAIGVTTAALSMADHPVGPASVTAVGSSIIAIVWNLAFNAMFEHWESRQATKGRGFWRRVCHAIGFEGGLVVLLVPLFAWVLDLSLWQALLYDIGLLLFFLVYTFVFNLCFDRVFGLPASAVER